MSNEFFQRPIDHNYKAALLVYILPTALFENSKKIVCNGKVKRIQPCHLLQWWMLRRSYKEKVEETIMRHL